MARDLFSRYIWIVDTLNRYEKLDRKELDSLWRKSSCSDGQSLPERTFYHYRRAIEDIFKIRIECDSAGRYSIRQPQGSHSKAFTNWMMENYALNSAITDSNIPPDSVEIEDVPSSRKDFPAVLEAIRDSRKIVFTYAGFNRSRAETGILFCPYFLKRYKQRWYIIGIKEKGNSIRTYALDRITELKLTDEKFIKNTDFSLDSLFGNIVGVTTSHAPVRTVRLRTNPTQAKYFRALPLHPSQQEEISDTFSIFTYHLKLNYELVHEILGFGSSVKVLEPKELQLMVTMELRDTLAEYEKD